MTEQNEFATVLGDLARLRMRDLFALAIVAGRNGFVPDVVQLKANAEGVYKWAEALEAEKRRLDDASGAG